jgi:hypothetical protein
MSQSPASTRKPLTALEGQCSQANEHNDDAGSLKEEVRVREGDKNSRTAKSTGSEAGILRDAYSQARAKQGSADVEHTFVTAFRGFRKL